MSESHENTDVRLHGFPKPRDAENFAARDHLELLATRFAAEVRAGRRPSIDDYAARYREYASQIRELFPLVESLERWKTDKEAECVQAIPLQFFPYQEVGRYKIVREIGRGGMGIVFEAVGRSDRRVAVKVLPWRYTSDAARRKRRFRREATTIARLRHPHIVPVYAFGEHEGYCYYVMQRVQGVSLAWIITTLRERQSPITAVDVQAALSQDPSPDSSATQVASAEFPTLSSESWTEFARIGVQVALAVAHAHKQGVLHSDIKPANVLLDTAGKVVVTDFGVGPGPADDASSEQDTGVGTLRYMAPERLRGRSDVRSDVFSLGVTLYELITQTPAFDAPDRSGLIEVLLRAVPKPPRQIRPRIPRDLERIVLQAMAADPDDRYPTARHLAADLTRFASGQPIQARPPGLLRRVTRWYLKHRKAGRKP